MRTGRIAVAVVVAVGWLDGCAAFVEKPLSILKRPRGFGRTRLEVVDMDVIRVRRSRVIWLV